MTIQHPSDVMIDGLEHSLAAYRNLEKAARAFVAADSWCACAVDHAASKKRCPCGYAQLRAAVAAIDQAARQ